MTLNDYIDTLLDNNLDCEKINVFLKKMLSPKDCYLNLIPLFSTVSTREEQEYVLNFFALLFRKDEFRKDSAELVNTIMEKFFKLSPIQYKNVMFAINTPFLESKELTIHQILSMSEQQQNALTSLLIQGLLASGYITAKEVCAFNREQCDIICSPAIHSVIKLGRLSFQEALKLTPVQFFNMEFAEKHALFNILTVEQIKKLTQVQRENMKSAAVRGLVQQGVLLAEEALLLTNIQRLNVDSAAVMEKYHAKELSKEDMLSLTVSRRMEIEQKARLGKLLNQGLLERQAEAPTDQQAQDLDCAYIQELLQSKQLTKEDVLAFTREQSIHMKSPAIRALLNAKQLSISKILSLTHAEGLNIEFATEHTLFGPNKLTLEQVINLSDQQRINFSSIGPMLLLKYNKLTYQQVLNLDRTECNYADIAKLDYQPKPRCSHEENEPSHNMGYNPLQIPYVSLFSGHNKKPVMPAQAGRRAPIKLI